MPGTRRGWRTSIAAAVLMAMTGCNGGAPIATPTSTTIYTTPDTGPPAEPTTSTSTLPPKPVDPYAEPGWVATENAKAGTADWQIVNDPKDPVKDTPDAWVEAYADTSSAQEGEKVTLFVDTPAPTYQVFAYRMGWYGGTRGRLVWSSASLPGGRQPYLVYDAKTGMAEAPWNPSTSFDVTLEWPPGAYLLKVVTSGGGAHYVPLTIRHDAAAADLLFMDAVTTWQAYNPWGGCTLYQCWGRKERQAKVVSFDRPYAHSYGMGAADFTTHELPLIAFIEQQGLDVAYITNIDLQREPRLASSRHALISPGHDEYYSWTMRQALVDALAAGSNLAFFGANAIYRNIRLEPGVRGQPEHRMANYRSADDPGANGDPHQVTVNWRQPPLLHPESEILGVQYGCAGVTASMRLVETGSWMFAGTGATEGQKIADVVGVEFDEMTTSDRTPAGLDVIGATSLTCRNTTYQQVTSYYSLPSGAGVFDAGTINWGCGLDGTCAKIPSSDVLRGVTLNVLKAFAAGPAGLAHPGIGTAAKHRKTVHEPSG